MPQWIRAVPLASIEEEDVVRFDHGARSYAIVRVGGKVYAIDGLCTHEATHLAGGLVMDHIIECPMHNGRFDVRDGRALGAPACIDLRTYPTRIDEGMIFLQIE